MHKAVQISECAIPKVELNARANQLFLHVKSDIFINLAFDSAYRLSFLFLLDKKCRQVDDNEMDLIHKKECVRSYYFISARRCLVNMQIFNHWHCPLFLVDVARYMCHLVFNLNGAQKWRRSTAKECFDYVTSFVMASFLNFKMVLIGRIEQCISPVHTVLRQRLEFILKEKFQCTKTGFQRCAMQISIAIKCALSSARAHSFVKLMKERKSEKADEKKLNKGRQKPCGGAF
ncbi:hypothetical protein T08_10880 [Trichinella sp. T8]|nr:hypothetical protein T08_10880 [Trichinella sp. T8]